MYLLSLYLCPFYSLIHYYHGLKKTGEGQPQNSVPIYLCFEIAKDTIEEDFFDQRELCPCQKKQRLNY